MQGFVGLALLSLANLTMTAVHLHERQTGTLDDLQALVEHRLGKGVGGGATAATHDLEDLIAHRTDTALELDINGTRSHFAAPEFVAAGEAAVLRSRSVSLVATPSTGNMPARATLLLDIREDRSLLAHLALTQLATSLIGALLAAVVAAWHVRRGLSPLRRLGEELSALQLASIGKPIDASGQPAELQPLVKRFNDVLARLDDAWRQMRTFNANVAHELKTPLATIASDSERLLSDSSLGAHARDLVGSNLEEVQRLDRIVRAMLFLASAERGASVNALERTSLARLVRDTLDYHDAVLEEAALQTWVDGDAIVAVDPMLIRQAVSNLIGNATRYATSGSTLAVSITSTGIASAALDAVVEVAVTNQGVTIPAQDLGRLFDRFYRSEPPMSPQGAHAQQSGHGLGLAIVAAIARMHGGAPFAVSANGTTRIGFTLSVGPCRSPGGDSERVSTGLASL